MDHSGAFSNLFSLNFIYLFFIQQVPFFLFGFYLFIFYTAGFLNIFNLFFVQQVLITYLFYTY